MGMHDDIDVGPRQVDPRMDVHRRIDRRLTREHIEFEVGFKQFRCPDLPEHEPEPVAPERLRPGQAGREMPSHAGRLAVVVQHVVTDNEFAQQRSKLWICGILNGCHPGKSTKRTSVSRPILSISATSQSR